ncbi:MAG: type 4a pilus biogenesis protein PilO [Acidiferrobacterales bacterium]|nr:type 4a pilus biogenesis protein PilO [Acidiferrobacterales bacterium]
MGLFEELKSIDINDIGSWTRRVKLFMAGILAIGIIALGYHFIIKDQRAELENVESKEPGLKDDFLEKKALAINLDAYKQQMVEAEETFGVLLKQLPNESEIPDLLIDMTQVGLSRGLQFEQIKPGSTIAKDFYAEKLVNIKVNGEYFQIASFISDIAALPRIINVDNFSLTRMGDTQNLKLEAVTKTYHYLDETYVSEE